METGRPEQAAAAEVGGIRVLVALRFSCPQRRRAMAFDSQRLVTGARRQVMNRLLNKAALITGGSTGIGRAVALAFAREGADVAVASRGHRAEAVSLAQEIEAIGRRCLPLRADVTSEADVLTVVEAVGGEFGRVDGFVDNRGGRRPPARPAGSG